MRVMALAGAAALCSTAAMPQDKHPSPAAKQAKQAKPKAAPAKPLSIAEKLQACLEIDDATKERLNCYDAVFKPKPNPKAPAAKGVMDCRFVKEEDERLGCFNGFAEKIPKFSS